MALDAIAAHADRQGRGGRTGHPGWPPPSPPLAARPRPAGLYYGAVADDLLAAVRARAQANLFWRTLGIEVVDARPGTIRLRLPIRDELCNAAGAPLHGGVVCSLVDMAIGGALGTLREASAGGVNQTSIELNVSFMAAARQGDVFAEGRILKHGRTLAFGEASITDADGNLLAVGRATYMILGPRKE